METRETKEDADNTNLSCEITQSELLERIELLEQENGELKKKLARGAKKKSKPVRFTMRVPGDDYALIKEKAETVRRPVTSFLIEAGLNKNIMLPEDAAVHQAALSRATLELKKIGNGFTQAIHIAHLENKFVEINYLENAVSEINSVIKRILKYL